MHAYKTRNACASAVVRRSPPLLLWVVIVATVTITGLNGLSLLVWGHTPPQWLPQVAAWVAILWTAWRLDRRR